MVAEKIGDGDEAGLAHTAPFETQKISRRDLVEALANAFEGAGDPALHKAACLRESDAENPIGLAFPLIDGELGEQDAGLIPYLKVIHSKVSRIRVRHIDGDQRDFGLLEDMRNVGRYVFLDLELEDEVDALPHKFFRILDSDVGIVAVVELQ